MATSPRTCPLRGTPRPTAVRRGGPRQSSCRTRAGAPLGDGARPGLAAARRLRAPAPDRVASPRSGRSRGGASPGIGHAGTTTAVDRKRLLRLVIAAVTVTVQPERGGADILVLWSGGARTAYRVDSPGMGDHLRTPASALDAIQTLAAR